MYNNNNKNKSNHSTWHWDIPVLYCAYSVQKWGWNNILLRAFDCFVACTLHILPVCCRFIHFCVTVSVVVAVNQLHNLNKLLCIADTTYLQYRPQWDLLQEPSRDGSAVGWSCSPQTSPVKKYGRTKVDWGQREHANQTWCPTYSRESLWPDSAAS